MFLEVQNFVGTIVKRDDEGSVLEMVSVLENPVIRANPVFYLLFPPMVEIKRKTAVKAKV